MSRAAPRALTADEHRLLRAARLNALELVPYFAHVLFNVHPLAFEGLGTFAVDASWRLYLDPAVLAEWGPEQAGAVLVHEAGHLVRDHAGRGKAHDPRLDHHLWNLAGDAAINDDLVRIGAHLPGAPVTPDALDLEPNGVEETYYDALTRRARQNGGGQDGERDPQSDGGDSGGCGSGAGGAPQPWEVPADQTAVPGVHGADQVVLRRQTAHAITEHAKTRGNVPAGLRRWAHDQTTTAPLPWRKVLAQTVRRSLTLAAGRITYSYARPGRRRLPGIVVPAMRAPRVRTAVVVDTSGSMSPDDLAAALVQIDGVVKGVGGSIDVLTCDAESGDAHRVRAAREVVLTGGGGTDMRVGIAAAERLRERPDVVVVLTDGFTPWPDQPTRAHLIVVVIGASEQIVAMVPTWATALHIPHPE